MADHSYSASLPDLQVDPAIKSFYESFYAASDKPDSIESWAKDFFTSDASLIMASKSAKGTEDIITLRKGMWAVVKSRKHTLYKIFPFGNNSYEVMLQGKVDFTLTNGKDLEVPWAGRAKLVKEGTELKMSEYQVYLDTAPTTNALK